MKNLTILGSTGSIGEQALAVVRETGCAKIAGLSAGSNIDALERQILEWKPALVSVFDERRGMELRKRLASRGNRTTEVLLGQEGNLALAAAPCCDMVLNSLVGSVGVEPTVAAIKAKKDVALANKETLVAAGGLVMSLARENGVKIYPVDSEHSAIFQCLRGNEGNKISKIYLTASGGPFLRTDASALSEVKAADALHHPNWLMGAKITIDSATMMNKGLELIEARWLFDIEVDKIQILVHSQSVVHSMVEFGDGAVLAQLGAPDMRLPIQYALTYPERLPNSFARLDFRQMRALTFEDPDFEKFPCLRIATDAIRVGGLIPAVMNAANEAAVQRFLDGETAFTDIPRIIEGTIKAYTDKHGASAPGMALSDILRADKWARSCAEEYICR